MKRVTKGRMTGDNGLNEKVSETPSFSVCGVGRSLANVDWRFFVELGLMQNMQVKDLCDIRGDLLLKEMNGTNRFTW